jgi:UDP-N-acetylglucosamine--N-acetylmuramyl-(pentapeptide) pyrophosphoryl-undecaprenol N-acetylglucosamine transferase
MGDGTDSLEFEKMSVPSGNSLVRIAFAGGGTGGHTAPILAVVDELRQRFADRVELLWLGGRAGPEGEAALARRVAFVAVPAAKLRRYADVRNFTELPFVLAGLLLSLRELKRFGAQALLSTGGYVSLPPTLAAYLLRIPILVHEQTALAGLATRIEARLASRVAVSFPSSTEHFQSGKVFVSGNPVRKEVLEGDRQKGLAVLGFSNSSPVVYITGGIQGAHALNRVVGMCLQDLVVLAQVVHQCGRQPAGFEQDLPWLLSLRERLPPELRARYVVRERIREEIGHVYAAADLVIGRAGAGTVFELAAAGRPAVLVPLPGSAAGEQVLNARALEALGAAVVLEQQYLNPTSLLELLRGLLGDRQKLRSMGEKARRLYRPDAAEVLADVLVGLATGRARARTEVL